MEQLVKLWHAAFAILFVHLVCTCQGCYATRALYWSTAGSREAHGEKPNRLLRVEAGMVTGSMDNSTLKVEVLLRLNDESLWIASFDSPPRLVESIQGMPIHTGLTVYTELAVATLRRSWPYAQVPIRGVGKHAGLSVLQLVEASSVSVMAVVGPIPTEGPSSKFAIACFRPGGLILNSVDNAIDLLAPSSVVEWETPSFRDPTDVAWFSIICPFTVIADIVTAPIQAVIAATGGAHVGPFPFVSD